MHDALGKGRSRWSDRLRGPVGRDSVRATPAETGPAETSPVRYSPSLALWGLIAMAAGCNPGELSDRQEEYLRDQLDEHYSAAGGTTSAATDRTSDGLSTDRPIATDTDPTEVASSTSNQGTAPSSQSSTPPIDVTSEATSGTVPPCATNIFQTACAGSFCHFQGTNLPPNFETDDVYTMLTTTKSGVCASAPSYIDLENPENSLLLLKVKGEQPGSCGGTMPPQPTTLSAEQMNCLEDWIGSL